jgi:DNA-binding NtrC family response regulator
MMEIKYSDLFWLHPGMPFFHPADRSEWLTAALKDPLVMFVRNISGAGFGFRHDAEVETQEKEARAEHHHHKMKRRFAEVAEFATEMRAKNRIMFRLFGPAGDLNVDEIEYSKSDIAVKYDTIADLVRSVIDVDRLHAQFKAILMKRGIRVACDNFRKDGVPALAILEKVDPIGRLMPLLTLATKEGGLLSVINTFCDMGGSGLTWVGDDESELLAALDRDYSKHKRKSLQPLNYVRLIVNRNEMTLVTDGSVQEDRISLAGFEPPLDFLPRTSWELFSHLGSVLSIDATNVGTVLAYLVTYASSPEVRARNEVPSFSDWLLPELAKQPRLLVKYYECEFPKRMKAFASIIGGGDAMCLAKCHAAQVAESEYSVLLLGESGTGKELFARAIHETSARREGPFVPVNCAAIPDDFFESELFGIEAKTATGVDKREGLFSQADGGTIFLDEIGECRLDNQTKLLRALQPLHDSGPCQLRIRAVGAKKEKDVDVRVVAGTNRNLLEMVRQNLFRPDLYYRLAAVTLKLPPLQDRGDPDLRQLTDFFWGRINRNLAEGSPNYRAKRLDESAYARIVEHSWPGNVRELENVLRQVAAMSLGSVVFRSDVNSAIAEIPSHAADLPINRKLGAGIKLDVFLEQIERESIEDAIKKSPGNLSEASRLLGLKSRTDLIHRMERLGIEQPPESRRTRHAKSEPDPAGDRSS